MIISPVPVGGGEVVPAPGTLYSTSFEYPLDWPAVLWAVTAK
jgi:hypothetical protein